MKLGQQAAVNAPVMTMSVVFEWLVPIVCGVAVIGAIGLAWVVILRRQIAQQTLQIRKQLELKTQSDARYRDLFDNAGDAVWETDCDGRILTMNHAAENLFGIKLNEAINHLISEFLLPEELDKSRGSKIRNVRSPFEITILTRGGSPTPVEVSSRVLPDRSIQTIARNITERKALQERALRFQKLEAVGRLAGGISHDFNNLLTVINGNCELLIMATPENHPNRHITEEILDAGHRAANLTRQLLAFSRHRSIENTSLDLNAVVTKMITLLRRLIGDQIELVTDLDPHSPFLFAEVGLIEQILMNLVLNSRDAMPSGGKLTIQTRTSSKGRALLIVNDTGTGMDPATKDRVFEPFFTTKPIGQGTGLGLVTVYSIVQSLGGDIRYESALGCGTTFEVELPLLSSQTVHSIELPNSSKPDALPPVSYLEQPRVVLLVEDDEAVRAFAQNVLEMLNLTVVTAENGQEAIEQVSKMDRLDLIVTDVLMPQMSGNEMIGKLRSQYPDLRVVFMSGFVGDDCVMHAALNVNTEFLQKPFTVMELMDKVRKLLEIPVEV